MALEITSVGAKVLVAFEKRAGKFPTTEDDVTWYKIPDINEAPEQDLSVETIDVSNIEDEITRYVRGRQDPGGDQSFTLNHTDAVITKWDKMVENAETKFASGFRLWFCYYYPGASKAYYWCGLPLQLGTSGIQQNELDTIPAHVVISGWQGWAAKPTLPSGQTDFTEYPDAGVN